MRKLLYNRWLVPTLLPGVLIALGIGVYEVTPPEPMCVIEAGSTQPVAFIEQGHRLLTYPSVSYTHLIFWIIGVMVLFI